MAGADLIDKDSFKEKVQDAAGPVLVDFFAPWCGHCNKLLPVVDELAGEMADKLTIVKMNVDMNREVAQKFDIKGLPTMILFKGGSEIDRLVGFMPKDKIVEKLTAKIG